MSPRVNLSSPVLLSLVCTVFLSLCVAGTRLQRNERSTAEKKRCLDKFKRIPNHSACLSMSSEAQNTGVSAADITLIVEKHNTYRSNVSPAASGMLKMSWDDEIASIAQGWAENCHYGHDEGYQRNIPGRFGLGQNVAKGYKDWTAALEGWYSEKDLFTFGRTDNNLHSTGHYTQVVWAMTYRVGCGYALCGSMRLYVCNYGPAGNMDPFYKPYKLGAQICAGGYRKGTLCDCGKDCLNGGTWNLVDCSCQCKKKLPFYVGDQCQLNCNKTQDNEPSYCGIPQPRGFDKTDCNKYGNVPYECPLLCEVCPWGGMNYKKGTDNTEGHATSTHPHYLVLLLTVLLTYLCR